jgi:KUP system potassium uptake protein
MTSDPSGTPSPLLHNLKHNKVLHAHVILLSVEALDVPRVSPVTRGAVEALSSGFWRVSLRYGFMESPDVPRDLQAMASELPDISAAATTYFLGRDRPVRGRHPLMPAWQEHLFAAMQRNARDASDYFQLPPNRVVELGSQVEM